MSRDSSSVNEAAATRRTRRVGGRRWFLSPALGILVVGLLYFSLRQVHFSGILDQLRSLRPWQILAVLALDALIYALFGARWWLLVRAENPAAGLIDAIAVRLSVFGASYFTFGPQVGGEPIQILYLRHRYGSTLARATATVALDKLLELLANFMFLLLGIGALLGTGIFRVADASTIVTVVAVLVLASWPLLHVLFLRRGLYPLSSALRLVPFLHRPESLLGRYIRVSERLVARFCQRRPGLMAAVLAVSLGACLLAVMEYALITSFLQIRLSPWQTVSAWTAGWLSFLVPVPAGVGALEASQVLALGLFGATANAAIGVSLLMRARDILFGGAGLLLAWRGWRSIQSNREPDGVL